MHIFLKKNFGKIHTQYGYHFTLLNELNENCKVSIINIIQKKLYLILSDILSHQDNRNKYYIILFFENMRCFW